MSLLAAFTSLWLSTGIDGGCVAAEPKPPVLYPNLAAARIWLIETVVYPVWNCERKEWGEASFTVRLNRRGQVSLRFSKDPHPGLRSCVELIVQPAATYEEGVDLDDVRVTLPRPQESSDAIHCYIEAREPKPSGDACTEWRDCGSGQVCVPSSYAPDAGDRPGKHRCIDYQRWLAARPR